MFVLQESESITPKSKSNLKEIRYSLHNVARVTVTRILKKDLKENVHNRKKIHLIMAYS